MALRSTLSKRLFGATELGFPSPIAALVQSGPSMPTLPDAAKAHFCRGFITSPDSAPAGFFRRFLQRRAINNHSSPLPSSFLALPVGEKLREKLKWMNIAGDQRFCLDGLSPGLSTPVEEEGFRVDPADVKRVLKSFKMEQVRERLRNIPASTIRYNEFVRVCNDVCGHRETGLEIAKVLDESGNVIVLGGVVFLRPDQVAKSMEKLISQSIGMPNDPRRRELENLEKVKALIDKKARSLVKGELYCGLGFLVLQTLGFMRLTFWELNWDVMEPICFFVTSLHFALAYAFFLRTSKEPSFEGYSKRRFKVKQTKLMKIHKFDVERYNKLCEAFYPRKQDNKGVVETLDHVRGTIFGSVHG